MRLLRTNPDGSFGLTWFAGDRIPRYVILSHRWDEDDQEVSLEDLSNGTAGSKRGYRKIQFCGQQAKNDGLDFFWVDSCCIDKRSSAELSEAVNSMFRWYRKAVKCYVYLSDVAAAGCSQPQWQLAFMQSKWFTRGWTLQELLAPRSVEFFSYDNERLGDKVSLESQIYEATRIAVPALQGTPLSEFSLDERLQWMVNRKTTIEEDFVYCLLGLLNIHIPLLYGEGIENAFIRLLEEIQKRSDSYIFRQDWKGVKTDSTPLLLAARLGIDILVRLLLDGEANVDLKDPRSGRTPLFLAAKHGHEAVVKLLLQAEASVDSEDGDSQTPLLWAAIGGHEGVVKLLLEASAGVDLKDKESRTPLSWAAKAGREGTVKLLLNSKADVNSKNWFGQTPLLLAAERGHESTVKLLLVAEAIVDLKDITGRTPLSVAAKGGHEGVVKLLLEAKAGVDLKDTEGRTPLSWAAEKGHESIVKLLLRAKAGVGVVDKIDWSPLTRAAEKGNERVVKLLLEAKASVKLENKESRPHKGIIKLFRSFNSK